MSIRRRLRSFRRRAQRGLTLLEIMIVIAILGILVAVIVPRVIGALSKGKNDLMKIAVDKIAYEDYPRWAASSTEKSCPDNLTEVMTFVGKTDEDSKDVWGTPFKFFCGKANLPPGVKDGIAVMSLGEDKTEGTSDDIKSWEKLKN